MATNREIAGVRTKLFPEGSGSFEPVKSKA